jgi:outer membrane protein assembly factor BamD
MEMKVLLASLLSLLVLVSCLPKKTKPVRSPGDLYVEGVKLMNMKKYDNAIKNFSRIREDFPFDPVAPYAMVKMADCYFFKKEYVSASKLYEEFLSSYPNDENIPYVLLKSGECYDKLSLSFERDQEYTHKAIEKYSLVMSRFPKSQYVKEAEEKRRRLEQKLADRELYVGEFYFRTYEYNASILRLEYLLKNYPDSKGIDKALFLLSKAYEELGNFEKAEYYKDRLRNDYPRSPFAAQVVSERKRLRQIKEEPKESPEREVKKEKKERNLPPRIDEPEKKGEEKFTFFDSKKGVDIVAEKMEGFEKERRVFFEGNVVLRQEDLTILSESLEAFLSEDKKEIEKVYARGNVRILKGTRTAICKEAEFDSLAGKIILKGDVDVISGSDRLKGERVIYYLNEDKVIVEGEKSKKAKVTIFPK